MEGGVEGKGIRSSWLKVAGEAIDISRGQPFLAERRGDRARKKGRQGKGGWLGGMMM